MNGYHIILGFLGLVILINFITIKNLQKERGFYRTELVSLLKRSSKYTSFATIEGELQRKLNSL